MSENKKIIICLGSSCYSRGNKKSLEIVKEYLEKNSLMNVLDFSGELCSGRCENGPVLSIGDKVFTHVEPEGVPAILKRELPVA